MIYWVGIVVESYEPVTFPFGEWELCMEGRTAVGKAPSGTFATVGATMGLESAASKNTGGTSLTTSQLPSHSHSVTGRSTSSNSGTGYWATAASGGSTASLSTGTSGSGSTHNHSISAYSVIQPSEVVYKYRRVA